MVQRMWDYPQRGLSHRCSNAPMGSPDHVGLSHTERGGLGPVGSPPAGWPPEGASLQYVFIPFRGPTEGINLDCGQVFNKTWRPAGAFLIPGVFLASPPLRGFCRCLVRAGFTLLALSHWISSRISFFNWTSNFHIFMAE